VVDASKMHGGVLQLLLVDHADLSKVYSNFFQGFDELNGSERRSCTSLLYVSRQMHSEARQALTRAYLFVHIMIMDVADLVDDVFKRFLDGAIVSDTVSMTPLSGLSIMISNPNTKRRDEKSKHACPYWL
jgi:hypothetical protein